MTGRAPGRGASMHNTLPGAFAVAAGAAAGHLAPGPGPSHA